MAARSVFPATRRVGRACNEGEGQHEAFDGCFAPWRHSGGVRCGGRASAKRRAEIASTAGNNVQGAASFTQQGEKVKVGAQLSGLSPGGHGFHLHEKGDCSPPDGMSAGGHFNPTGKPHGAPDAAERGQVRRRPQGRRRLQDATGGQLGSAHRLRRHPEVVTA
jgi:Copper/zinc superoxide dismutase (SODC)